MVPDPGTQDLVARTKGSRCTILEGEEKIAFGNTCRPVRRDDHRTTVLLCGANGCVERLRTFGVEIRVRLVEHENNRVTVKRPRKTDALVLAVFCPRVFDSREGVAKGDRRAGGKGKRALGGMREGGDVPPLFPKCRRNPCRIPFPTGASPVSGKSAA